MSLDWLLYFSIACFALAFAGACLDFVHWINKQTHIAPYENKTVQPGFFQQVKNVVSPPKYELTVSYIQFCREVVKWTGPILKREGIKYYPKVIMRYGKGKRTMGTYSASQNLVTINLNSHDRKDSKNFFETIASTTLHEVCHHIQSKKDQQYNALTNYKKYGYWSNRIEVEARDFESKYYQQCFEDLVAKGIVKKVK